MIVRGNYYSNVYNGVYEFLGTTDEDANPNVSPITGTVAANPTPPPAYRFTRTDDTGTMPYQVGHVVRLSQPETPYYAVVQGVTQSPADFLFDAPGSAPPSPNGAVRVTGAIGGNITLDSGTRYKFTRSGVTNAMPFELGDIVVLRAGTSVQYVTVSEVHSDPACFFFDAASAPASPSAAIRMFRVDNLVVEDNIFELAFNMVERHNQSPPCAINITSRNPINGPWVYGSVIVRGNLIRHLNGAVDPYYLGDSRGVDVSSCRSLIVESNVIGLESANSAIRAYACGTVKPLNNVNFAGLPLSAFRWDLNLHVGELRTQAEDLFLQRFG